MAPLGSSLPRSPSLTPFQEQLHYATEDLETALHLYAAEDYFSALTLAACAEEEFDLALRAIGELPPSARPVQREVPYSMLAARLAAAALLISAIGYLRVLRSYFAIDESAQVRHFLRAMKVSP
ncbi:hypothetical protein [Tahibacter amnicola]|uniref:Uncharacterized protein n=1 Tax=Tahibacter amnicola TaxID=2976241 RepID=A0ABY6BJZ7_9GAMM|nr:hypothetical protein [Tahibacter amnicola]UXI68921.1 hypothetical protein N4264_04495 [Tahibacter amnicola]